MASTLKLDNSRESQNEWEFYTVQRYLVPKWAEQLRNIPKHVIKLSSLNTPIHKWKLPGIPSDIDMYIKRDDLTGADLSGSKVRPLQVIFAEALEQGAKHVLTGGGPQSGFARAVCLTSRLLGITPHVIVRGIVEAESVGAKGNILLHRIAGSKIYLTPFENPENFNKRIDKMAQHVSNTTGEKCYPIPLGGALPKAAFMYISMFEEMLNQGLKERFDDVVVAVGSGGISVGLAIGNYLSGSSVRIHAVTVSRPKEEMYDKADTMLHQLGLESLKSKDILDIIDGYIGVGYGKATDAGLDFITKISTTTGILLDPYYTSKAVMGMVEQLNVNPTRFKGKRILFIHTGGIFALFDGEMERVVDNSANANEITLAL